MQETCTVGGVMSGYCATGSMKAATPPITTITIDSTQAKIGRSMKNLAISSAPQLFLRRDGHRDYPGHHDLPAAQAQHPPHHDLVRRAESLAHRPQAVLPRPEQHLLEHDPVSRAHDQNE